MLSPRLSLSHTPSHAEYAKGSRCTASHSDPAILTHILRVDQAVERAERGEAINAREAHASLETLHMAHTSFLLTFVHARLDEPPHEMHSAYQKRSNCQKALSTWH